MMKKTPEVNWFSITDEQAAQIFIDSFPDVIILPNKAVLKELRDMTIQRDSTVCLEHVADIDDDHGDRSAYRAGRLSMVVWHEDGGTDIGIEGNLSL